MKFCIEIFSLGGFFFFYRMSQEQDLDLVVQTGNFVTPPNENGTPGEWKVSQEWRIKAGSGLT